MTSVHQIQKDKKDKNEENMKKETAFSEEKRRKVESFLWGDCKQYISFI